MEITDSNIQTLASYLQCSLNPDYKTRRDAERFLEKVEINDGYSRLLMCLLDKPEAPLEIRIACAVTLKNFVKRNWRVVEGEPNKIGNADRDVIKQQLMRLMLTTPEAVQRQLAETISLVGLEDFPERWPSLLSEMIEQFATGNMMIINSVLQTANSLFKRYRNEMKSNELWMEIKYVLENFAAPLTELFVKTNQLAKQQMETTTATPMPVQAVAATLKPTFQCLALISKIFYSLNAQDLPEFFEDHMNVWMPIFLELLNTNVPALRIPDDDETDETGVIEDLWSQICDNIAMYAQKYDEEFAPYLPQFVGVVWQLLVTTGKQTRYDLLVSNAVQFLASVCEREQYKMLFEGGDTLAQICEKVIIPNMEFRTSDEELFEDNPEEFIRKDIEGSDVDTRRRSAADLVKALCKHFESSVIQIFSAYIGNLFQQYESNPKELWARKDAAIYLVVSLASKGQTVRFGSTKTSELVNLVDFFRANIAVDLNDVDVNRLPVLKADALKYVITFRSQLPKELLVGNLAAIVRLMTADSVVVHTYAAHALERILTIKDSTNGQSLIGAADLKPHAELLFTNLFGVFEKRRSTENEYAMKCLMRCLSTMSDFLMPFSDLMISKLAHKIVLVAKNPSKPHFNHYLFECLCVLIKSVCKQDPVNGAARFELVLFPPFQEILQQDVVEFMPYVFQVLSLVLDVRGAGAGVPETYQALFPFLLVPTLWERSGNVPALVKLLQAYLRVGADSILANHLNPLLGIFQKLIASPMNDHEGFALLNTIVEFSKWESLTASMKAVFTLLFTRLKNKKTVKFVKGLIGFTCLFVIRYGARQLVETMDSVQPDIFGMFVEKVFLVDLQKIGGRIEKKICSVGISNMLVEMPEIMLCGKYSRLWPGLLQGLVSLFELPEETSGDDEYFVDVENAQGYSAAYSQLAYANRAETDPTHVADVRSYLVKSLQKLNVGYAEKMTEAVQLVDEKIRNYLQQYLTGAV